MIDGVPVQNPIRPVIGDLDTLRSDTESVRGRLGDTMHRFLQGIHTLAASQLGEQERW